MRSIPLFTRAELAHAFALLMSEGAANRWADEWFARFAGDEVVDENGFYLYLDWTADEPSVPPSVRGLAVGGSASDQTGFEHLGRLTEDELGEHLMDFGGFHLNLLSLSSPVVFDRIRAGLGDSLEAATRGREQMRRIVQAITTRD